MEGNFSIPSTDIIVEKISIATLVGYFILYIILHVGIGWYFKKCEEELKNNPTNEDIIQKTKVFRFLFKWFPAIYVVLLIFAL